MGVAVRVSTLTFSFILFLMGNAESLLLIYDYKSQVLEFYVLGQ